MKIEIYGEPEELRRFFADSTKEAVARIHAEQIRVVDQPGYVRFLPARSRALVEAAMQLEEPFTGEELQKAVGITRKEFADIMRALGRTMQVKRMGYPFVRKTLDGKSVWLMAKVDVAGSGAD
jgi:hypothetical protein